jgi:hypothetical protein
MVRILLGIGCLLLLWAALVGPSGAQPREPALPKSGWPLPPVTGRAEDVETAKEVAAREAVRLVTELMRQQHPPLHSFVVSEDYLRQNLLGEGKPGKITEIELPNQPKKIYMEWIWTFRNDPKKWGDLVRQDQRAERQAQAEQRKVQKGHRQDLLQRIIFGLSLLLMAGFGYVRLNEYTQRRYTAWLRVSGVFVASLALAGWWWMLTI